MIASPSVLLVEDDPSDAALFKALLVDAGLASDHVVHQASLGDALKASTEQPFDVVLLDLSLPDSQGIDAIDSFAQSCPDLPVVVLTGNRDLTPVGEALRLGAEDYLIKGETGHGNQLLRALSYAIERKRARDEMSRLQQHLMKAQRLESLEVLAGGVAHDFNNLLVGILGNASMVLSDLPPSAEVLPLVVEIERSALLAADLTRQMLAYAGKGRFVVSVLDLSQIVAETQGLLLAGVSANATMRFDVSPEALPVRVDATQIQQTLMNLVTNASEALEGTRGTITVTTGLVNVDQSYIDLLEYHQSIRPGRYAFLEVTDTGVGMDAEARARIFDPFFSTKFAGRGLGLAASLGITRGHEGAFKVYSEPGQGTSFKVLLPLASAQGEEEESSPAPSQKVNGRVLVVDDNDSARGVARRVLCRAGFEVLVAVDGEEALAVFATHRKELDLVLLDMTMPRLSGEETCRRILQMDPSAKVVMMSGYNEQEVVRRLDGRRLTGFLQKPFRPQDLIATIQEALEG